MRILHIINKMSTGGAQSLVAELTIGQKKAGHDVSILELMPSPNDILRIKVKQEGVVIHNLNPIGNVYNPFVIFSILPYLKKYDIIHVHLFPAQYWVALAKLISFSKVPLYTTEHSTNNKRRSNVLMKSLDCFIYKQYKKIIACADKAQESFQKQFPSIECCSVPNGVNIAKYWNAEALRKRDLGMCDSDFMVTMVARFDYPKRQDTVIEAISKLPNKFHAVFVGGVPEKQNAIKCHKLADSLGVENRIHFMYIRSDVHKILKTSDAIVMSSEYEGLSLSSIEGMAGGKPFISTDVNGLREVVDGAGILFQCGNSDELASILLRLSIDKKYYDTVVERCLERAKQYDIDSTVKKYIEIYKTCLSKI